MPERKDSPCPECGAKREVAVGKGNPVGMVNLMGTAGTDPIAWRVLRCTKCMLVSFYYFGQL